MNLLISGSSGFVGTNLRYHLSSSNSVVGITRNSTDHTSIKYEELNTNSLDQFDAFIHLAGKAHDTKNSSESKEYFEINTELTKRVFDIFMGSKCEVFIFVSSVKAVSDKPKGVLYESSVPGPVTAYGKSKLAAENYIFSRPIPKNKRVYILRPCMIHGPGNKGNLNLLYKIVSKAPFPLGKFENKRSFLSIHNFCFVVEGLLKKKIKSGVFNVADDSALSTNELVRLISSALDKKVTIVKVPKQIVRAIARIGDVLPFPLNTDRLDKLTENYVVSNKKIKEALEIEKLPESSADGLHKTIKSFMK